MLERRVDRQRLGEKTRKETKNAENLVFTDHCLWLHWEVGPTSMRLNSNWRPDPSFPVLGLVLCVQSIRPAVAQYTLPTLEAC